MDILPDVVNGLSQMHYRWSESSALPTGNGWMYILLSDIIFYIQFYTKFGHSETEN